MKKKIIITVITLVILTTCCIINRISSKTTYSVDRYESHLINDDETIWELAEENKAEGMDTRYYVTLVSKINGINPDNITSGNYILLPIYE